MIIFDFLKSVFSSIRSFLADAFGLGNPCVKILKELRGARNEASSESPDVELSVLERKFGSVTSDCIKSLISDGYIKGVTVPNNPHVGYDAAGHPCFDSGGYHEISPYHITARGLNHLNDLRHNAWILFVSTAISILSLIFAIAQAFIKSDSDVNSSKIVEAVESQRLIQEQILEEEKRQTAIEREINGKLDELIASQSEQTGILEGLRGEAPENQSSAVSVP